MKSDKLTIGILAHVDAGKTTLSENILFETGQIRKMGRVDHKDAFLDTHNLERDRGITIFSKQAMFPLDPFTITLLDTPGHVDFSAEMERVLRVLDYAILVISATDGVQGHTSTVWKLLKKYHVPTFIFVNKMDLIDVIHHKPMDDLQAKLHENCQYFAGDHHDEWMEQLALSSEQLMESYLENGLIEDAFIRKAIVRRQIFPVYMGSALKNEGISELLDGLKRYMTPKSYPDIFGARVFKVTRNDQGERLTYVKVTGGSLKVKTSLTNRHQKNVELSEDEQQEIWQEKVDQVRIYSGTDFELVKEVSAGSVCALTGLSQAKPGDGLGFEHKGEMAILKPVLSYKVLLPEASNVFTMLKNLRILEEEEPLLNIVWVEQLSEIHVQVMGAIQIEILKSTILERFEIEVAFDQGNLVYLETIKKAVIGKGHFEPLKHYAEAHLLMEPLGLGEGLIIESQCSEDHLERNWQRLILSHLNERQHPGVLTGSAITDMRITLVAGRGHKKHTEGGDFREATFRALRQGLMSTECQLLEPVYDYTLEIPREYLGRAISDMERLYGRYEDPVIEGDSALLKGVAPVSTMMSYSSEVVAYTRGQGKLSLMMNGYEPCHNEAEVMDQIAYEADKDTYNPSGSVFCSKGSGYGVPWDQVDSYMHVASGIILTPKTNPQGPDMDVLSQPLRKGSGGLDDELEAIFTRTYGERKNPKLTGGSTVVNYGKSPSSKSNKHSLSGKKNVAEAETFLLVDGYNIIFAWDNLKHLAEEHLDSARLALMDILCDYQGQKGDTVILVFDAYRVAGNRGDAFKYHNINVVYTKEAETADQYIERLVHDIRPNFEVTVATSDVVEQIIIMGKGARRLSAEAFEIEVQHLRTSAKNHFSGENIKKRHRPLGEAMSKKGFGHNK